MFGFWEIAGCYGSGVCDGGSLSFFCLLAISQQPNGGLIWCNQRCSIESFDSAFKIHDFLGIGINDLRYNFWISIQVHDLPQLLQIAFTFVCLICYVLYFNWELLFFFQQFYQTFCEWKLLVLPLLVSMNLLQDGARLASQYKRRCVVTLYEYAIEVKWLILKWKCRGCLIHLVLLKENCKCDFITSNPIFFIQPSVKWWFQLTDISF